MSIIEASLQAGYQVKIVANGHVLLADEPVSVGGADTGPTPYELLLGALAACTCMTVQMYCQRKGWALDGVSVRYVHSRVHAEDCAECDDPDHRIDHIESAVTITGDFDESQAKRLQSVAARCPVHKTLEAGVRITDNVRVTTAGGS